MRITVAESPQPTVGGCCDGRNGRCGSRAAFSPAADDFRSSLTNRPFQGPSASLTGANTLTSQGTTAVGAKAIARSNLPRVRSLSSPTTRHAHSNIRSTNISMPSAISWNAASQNSSSSAASQPASKRPPEITGPSSLSQPSSSYGCDKCPHHLMLVCQRIPPKKSLPAATNCLSLIHI